MPPQRSTSFQASGTRSGLDGKPLVLVVEDDPVVRSDIVRRLNYAEYAVHDVPSAHHALDYLVRHALGVSCVLADQRMPGPSGTNLLDQCERRWPWLGRVIYTGAYDAAVSFVRGRHWIVEKTSPKYKLYDAVSRAIAGERPPKDQR